MSDVPQLTIELNSSIDELSRLAESVDEFSGIVVLPESSRYQLQLVLEELFVNFVTHGCNPGGQMTVSVHRSAEHLEIVTRDDGVPFNPLLVAPADTSAPLEQRPVGGLGIHLMRQLGDSLSWEHEHGHNIICMKLRLDG